MLPRRSGVGPYRLSSQHLAPDMAQIYCTSLLVSFNSKFIPAGLILT